MVELRELLMFMTRKGASDLHLKPMRPPLVRIDGRLVPVKAEPLQPDQIERMLLDVLTPSQRKRFEAQQAVDLGYGVPGVARFRCNMFLQRGTIAAVFRRIPFEIKSIDDLNLPDVIETFAEFNGGLVLVTGPTGSGKSTTLAALIKRIAERRAAHIVTIEDPIEFLFSDDRAALSQREVGTDTPSFRDALRNAMRQDPDVIMVGEMRDLETISTVLTAAETGHLVFSTLHTNSAAQTVDRIIDSFPSDHQQQVRSQLSLVLKAVVSEVLIRGVDGGLLPAAEVLINSPKIAKHIAAGEIKEIHEEMESSVTYFRMQSMNQSLIAMLAHGSIDHETAVEVSPDREDLSLKLRKIFPEIDKQSREDDVAPSTADFSQIAGLLEIKKLYEDAEERHAQRVRELEARIAELEEDLAEMHRRETEASAEGGLDQQIENLKAENQRIRNEATSKINGLNDRIRELNQRLIDATSGGKGSAASPGGYYKR